VRQALLAHSNPDKYWVLLRVRRFLQFREKYSRNSHREPGEKLKKLKSSPDFQRAERLI
jgi:hypothetical protein